MLNQSDYTRLENILIKVFPNQEVLKIMVLHQLNENLDVITKPDNLKSVIFELVQWAKKEGRVNELASGSLKEEPGSRELQDLQLFCLFLLLDQANFTFEECQYFYKRVMPPHPLPYSKHLSLKEDDDIHAILFRLSDMPAIDNRTPISAFVRLVMNHEKSGDNKDQFNEWLTLVAKANNYPSDLEPMFESGVGNQSCKFLSILVIPHDEHSEKTAYAVKILDQDFHPLLTLPQINDSELNGLAVSILDVLYELADKGFDTQDTTIEFFLPVRLLSEAVDQYQLPTLGQPVEIGFMHRVVVRSIERSQKPYFRNLCKKKWDQISNGQILDPQRFTRIDTFDSLASNFKLHYELMQSEHICVGITCVPKEVIKSVEVFNRIILGGIPIALWLRPIHDNTEVTNHDEIFNLIKECDLYALPDIIHNERCKTIREGEGCGNRYTLLWDDPYRAPYVNSLRA